MYYLHPGYKKLYPIQTVLRDLASQEGCDGEPYDAMIFAAQEIDRLHKTLEKMKMQAVRVRGEQAYRELPSFIINTIQEATRKK